MKKLSELVSSALDGARAKIASVSDAEHEHEEEKRKKEEAEKKASAAPARSTPAPSAEKIASVVETAKEAMKFAESLEHLAAVFPKMAEMGTNRGGGSTQINDINGPQTLVSPDKGVTRDSDTKATSVPAQRAHSGGGPGKGMHVETNKGGYSSPDWTKNKEAAEAVLNAKIAQSNALLAVGRAKEAADLANTARAEFERAKKAYEEEDASTKTPKGNPQTLPVNRHPGDLPVPTGPVKDNKGMIDMTKRDAKTKDVRTEAAKHLSEPALSSKSDKGLQDNLDHTEGAKIAASKKVASILDTVQARKSKGAASAA